MSIPLAIDTDADSTVDVPWSSSGVLASAGVFSGQVGRRAATLLLADADAGLVVLVAGWDGGPSASTQFSLTGPLLRLPAAPSYGTNGPDFEPNDPAGNAFRRDDVVPIELDDLPQPLALLARLDGSNAKTSVFPVTRRCDAGSCWLVDLPLAEVDLPAFRGRVLVWASAADGGLQTRPRAIPVTRWRWRRQVSAVPNPVSVTRPTTGYAGPNDKLFVGSSDTATTGRFLHLRPNGEVYNPGRGPAAAARYAGGYVSAANTPDGGVLWYGHASLSSPLVFPTAGAPTTCVPSRWPVSRMVCLAEGNTLELLSFPGGVPSHTTVDAGCTIRERAGLFTAPAGAVIVNDGTPICVSQLQGSTQGVQTTGSYLRAFASESLGEIRLFAAGSDGGLWLISDRVSSSPLEERLVWDGGLVDGIAVGLRQSPANSTTWAFWATADRRVHAAPSAALQDEATAPELLPDRVATTPVLAFGASSDAGSVFFVSRNGAVSAYDRNRFTRTWVLEPGDAGIRGGRVDSEPIAHHYCGRLGSLLVPSSGDGSLYSFALDDSRFEWFPWSMSGSNPMNDETGCGPCCISD